MVCVIRVKKCCCGCCSLRCGTIAVGMLYLVVAILGAAFGFGYKSVSDSGFGLFYQRYFLLLLGFSCGVWIVVNVTLLQGAVTRRAELLVPWLVWHMVLPVLSLINLIWSFFVLIYDFTGLVTNTAMFIVIHIILSHSLLVYFSIVVYSFYKDLKESTYDVQPSLPAHTKMTSRTVVPSAPCTTPQQIVAIDTASHYSQGITRHYPVL